MSVKRSTTTAALMEPFDDDIIENIDGFDNVAPHHYVQRLIDVAPGDYSIELGPPTFHGKAAVSVNGKLTLHTDGGDRVFSANGTKPLVNEDGEPATDPEAISGSIKNAQSDALKLAAKHAGVGLHLYFNEKTEAPKPVKRGKAATKPAPVEDEEDEEEEEEAPAPRRRTSSSNARGRSSNSGSKGGSDWDSKRDTFTYPIGKNKDTIYSALDSGFLTWAEENLDPEDKKFGKKNAAILKCVQDEIKYRKANDLWEEPKAKKGSSKPTRKRSIADEDEGDDF